MRKSVSQSGLYYMYMYTLKLVLQIQTYREKLFKGCQADSSSLILLSLSREKVESRTRQKDQRSQHGKKDGFKQKPED